MHCKRKTPLIALTAFLLALLALSTGGCRSGNPEAVFTEPGFPVTITDSMHREVIIPKQPSKIISLSPANTEVLFALGLGDRLAGVTDYCDYPSEAKSKPKIGGFSTPSVEAIIGAMPDLVVGAGIHENIVKQLEGAGIPVLLFEARDMEGILANIMLTGKATGTDDRASDLTRSIEERIKAIKEKLAGLPEGKKPRVFFELWYDPLTTGGRESILENLITTAGGRNIASDVNKDWVVYSLEMLLTRDPEVIIYTHHVTSGQSREQVMARQGWQGITAIKSGRIYVLSNENIVLRSGPRIADGLEELARMIHPQLFN